MVSAVEVALVLDQLTTGLESRKADRFLLPATKREKDEHIDREETIDEVFQKFYSKYRKSYPVQIRISSAVLCILQLMGSNIFARGLRTSNR